MRVVHSTADSIELRGRGSAGTPLIVGTMLMCWPILATVMVGTLPTGDRLLSTVLLVSVASLLIAFGRPRRHTIRLHPRARTVESERGTAPLGDDASLRLVAAPAQPVGGVLRYGVALEARGTLPLLVLTGLDPARVLEDVVALRAHLPLPVRTGWGLSRNAIPWLGPSSAETDASVRTDDPVEPTRRRSTTALGVGSAAAAGLLLMEIHGRASRGDPMSVISIVLPALAVLLLGTLTFISASSKRRVSAGAALVWEWRLGVFTLQRRSVDAAAIRRAELVSPTGQGSRHLLVYTTTEKFMAFECPRSDGAAAIAKLTPEAERTPSG
jgi:hypothetical protein